MNSNTPVSEVMTEFTLSINPEDKLNVIQNIFKKHLFHHLPVVDKNHRVVGIISKSDLHLFFKQLTDKSSGRAYSMLTIGSTKAEDIMTEDPMVIEPEDTLGLAADIFMANTIHALPVVEDDKLVGIVTTHDLLNYAFKEVAYKES